MVLYFEPTDPRKYCRPTAKSRMGWCKRSNPADPNSVHMGHGNISKGGEGTSDPCPSSENHSFLSPNSSEIWLTAGSKTDRNRLRSPGALSPTPNFRRVAGSRGWARSSEFGGGGDALSTGGRRAPSPSISASTSVAVACAVVGCAAPRALSR